MKFKNKNASRKLLSKKQKIILLTSVILLLAVSLTVYALSNTTDTPKINPDNTSQTNKKESDQKPAESDSEPSTESDVLTQDGEEVNRSPGYQPPQNGQVTITRIESNNEVVTVAALVQGVNDGTCTVVFSNQGNRAGGSAPVQIGPSYYACQIDIPRSSFNTGGKWLMSLEVKNANASASATGEIQL